MDMPLIEFKDVTKRFGSKTVLDSVNLQIYEGEVTTIIGLSGSGKSVLLKHIIGLIEPDAGTILFRGKPLAEMKKKETAASLATISYMFQYNALFDSLTVYENIALPLRERTSLGKAEIDRRRAPVQQVLSEARNLDVDLEQRDRIATFDSDLDLVGIDGDVPADGRENLLVKNGNEVGVARPPSLMHQQDLQPMLRGLGRALAAEPAHEFHAALRPNSLLNRPLLSRGTTSGTDSPLSLRATSS